MKVKIRTKKPIHSYVPEKALLKRMENIPTQVFVEACVLFAPTEGFRIYACNGADLAAGQSLDAEWGMDAEEAAFLQARATKLPLTLACGKERALLVFSAFYDETGLLLGLIPKGAPEAVCAAVIEGELCNAVPSPAAKRCAEGGRGEEPLDEACVASGVYVVTHALRYLRSDAPASMEDRVCWLTRTLGCPVEVFPSLGRKGGSVKRPRWLIAYLLCLFLALRGPHGHLLCGDREGIGVQAEGAFRLEWSAEPSVSEGDRMDPISLGDFPDFDFMRLACFENVHLRHTGRGLFLRVQLSAPVAGVRSLLRERSFCAALWILTTAKGA
jgi:hypothetical protein